MTKDRRKAAGTSHARTGWFATIVGTITGNLYLMFGTCVMSILAILVSWVPPRGNAVFGVARLWSRGLLFFSGARLDAAGGEGLKGAASYVFMSNHQSMYDIPALLASLPVQTRFLAKRSLFKIPIFGWAIALGGFISVDRSDRSRARESFAAAVEQLKRGASTLVFPEGTRSLDGRLSKFERGGFLLALKSGLAIVPVGIHGSLAVRKRGSLVVRPGRIGVRYGQPIEVERYGIRGRAELESVVRERLADLMAQAGAGD